MPASPGSPKGRNSSSYTIVAFTLLTVALTAVLLTAHSAPKPGNPKISWTPKSLNATVSAGTSNTFNLSFVATDKIANVALRVVPELQPFVQVSPSTIPQINAGETVPVTVTVTASALTLPQTVSGTIQLRSTDGNNGTIANPLPVAANIVWQQLQEATLGLSLTYPPTFFPSLSGGSKLQQITFSENQSSYAAGITPILVITMYPLASGQSIRDRIHSFGVADADITEVLIEGRTFLKWAETGGIADEAAVSYSTLAPSNRMLTFNVVSGVLSPALNGIISSLTFTTP